EEEQRQSGGGQVSDADPSVHSDTPGIWNLVHLYKFSAGSVNGERTIAPTRPSAGPEPPATGGAAAGHDRAAGGDRGQVGDAPGGGRAGRRPVGVDDVLLPVGSRAGRGGPQAPRGGAGGRAVRDGGSGPRGRRGQRHRYRRAPG